MSEVRISEIKAYVFPQTEPVYRWSGRVAPRPLDSVFISVKADSGHEGQCVSWMMLTPGEVRDAMPMLRKKLIGRDPHDVEGICQELTFGLERPTRVASHLDVALWDLVGKIHNEPLYRLFGATRTKLPVYGDLSYREKIDDYVKGAIACREAGFLGMKLHPYCTPDKDIEVCRAVREAMGNDFSLFIDAHNAYDRAGALKVGRVLDELNFVWFEAPILDSDIQGLAALSRAIDTPVAGAEHCYQGIRAYPPYLINNACSILRGFGDIIGGITALRKAAAVCQAFNVRFEPHSYGTPHMIAAHLHVMFSMTNCEWAELPFQNSYESVFDDGVRVQKDGHVHAPTRPGLGFNVNMDKVDNLAIEVI